MVLFIYLALPYDFEISIPCTSVYDIRKCSKKILPKEELMFFADGFELQCSNIRSFKVEYNEYIQNFRVALYKFTEI